MVAENFLVADQATRKIFCGNLINVSYFFPANYNREVVQSLPAGLEPGVYYGWAQVDNGPLHKMVANIGWCPFYNNEEMSVVSNSAKTSLK